jgi:hypothetical protein
MFKNALKLALGLFLVFVANANAQKIEYGIALNSGLFAFRGDGVAKNGQFNAGADGKSGYVNNPYIYNSTMSYGFSFTTKFIKNHAFIGLDLGYDLLRSKTNFEFGPIPAVMTDPPYQTYKGKSILNQNFINLFPSLGYKKKNNEVTIEFMLGTDLAYCLSAKERYDVISNTKVSLIGTNDRKAIDFDIRPRVQGSVGYMKCSFYVGYSVGVKDYNNGQILIGGAGGSNVVRANYIRFGLSYKLN